MNAKMTHVPPVPSSLGDVAHVADDLDIIVKAAEWNNIGADLFNRLCPRKIKTNGTNETSATADQYYKAALSSLEKSEEGKNALKLTNRPMTPLRFAEDVDRRSSGGNTEEKTDDNSHHYHNISHRRDLGFSSLHTKSDRFYSPYLCKDLDTYGAGKLDKGPRAFSWAVSVSVGAGALRGDVLCLHSSEAMDIDDYGNDQFVKAIDEEDEKKEEYQRRKQLRKIVSCALLFNLGLARHVEGDHVGALHFYIRGREVLEGKGVQNSFAISLLSFPMSTKTKGVGCSLLNNLGCILYRRGNVEEALLLFEEAVYLVREEEWEAMYEGDDGDDSVLREKSKDNEESMNYPLSTDESPSANPAMKNEDFLHKVRSHEEMEVASASREVNKSVEENQALNQATALSNLGRCQYRVLLHRQAKGDDSEHQQEAPFSLDLSPDHLASICLDVSDIRSSILASSHPDAVAAAYNLGLAREMQRKYDKALICFQDYVEAFELTKFNEEKGEHKKRSLDVNVLPAYVKILRCSILSKMDVGNASSEKCAAFRIFRSLESLQFLQTNFGPDHITIVKESIRIGASLRGARLYQYSAAFYKEALRVQQLNTKLQGTESGQYSSAAIWHGLGNAQRDQGRVDESLRSYCKALDALNNGSTAIHKTGLLQEDQEASITTLHAAVRADVGLAYERRGCYEGALNWYCAALSIARSSAVHNLSVEAAARRNEDIIRLLRQIGSCRMDRGDYADAVTSYIEAVDMLCRLFDSVTEVATAETLEAISQEKVREERAERLRFFVPALTDAARRLAFASLRGYTGQVGMSEALNACAKALSRLSCFVDDSQRDAPPVRDLFLLTMGVGRMHRFLGRTDDALECYRRCVSMASAAATSHPNRRLGTQAFVEALRGLAGALVDRGEWSEANAALSEAGRLVAAVATGGVNESAGESARSYDGAASFDGARMSPAVEDSPPPAPAA